MSKDHSKSQINDIPPQEVPQDLELPNYQTPKQETPNEKNPEQLVIEDEDKPLKEKKPTEAIPEKTAPKPKQEVVYPEVSYFKVQYATAECSDYFFLFIGLIGSLGMGVSMPLFSLIFGNTINNFGPQNSMADFVDRINSMVLKFVYCAIGMFVGSGLMVSFFTVSGKRATSKLKSKYFETIMKQEQGYFDKANPFEYSTKVQSQTKVIETGLGDKVGNAIMSVVMFIASFIIGFTTSWKLSLALCAVVPFMGGGGYFFTKLLMEGFQKKQKEYEKAGGLAEEVIYNIKTVASFGNLKKEVKDFDEILEKSMDSAILSGLYTGIGMGLVFALIYVSYTIAIWYGAYLIANKEWNSNNNTVFQAGDVMTVLFSVIFGSFALGQASPNIKAINDGVSAAAELFWLIDRKPEINVEKAHQKPPKDSIKGGIKFENVTFAYPSEPDKDILKNFSFDFPAGKKIAIVGKSGSGKSTVIGLIERLYDIKPGNGSIFVDGLDVSHYDLNYFRSCIGYVPQEPVLFNISIKENIEFGRQITSEQLKIACDKAHATEFIEKIKDKHEYRVGIKGSKLSGGQKQRIAIARAIANDPKILILDEATSALDNESEKIVQKALDTVSNGVTTIIIAHRLTTIKNADIIVVMKKGKIVEQGTHDELIKLNKRYAKLVKHQMQDQQNPTQPRRESVNEMQRMSSAHVLSEGNVHNENQPIVAMEQKPEDPNEVVVVDEEQEEKRKMQEEQEKAQKDEEYFQHSKGVLMSYLSDYKGTIFVSALFSSCNGAVWPVYGIVLGFAIDALSGTNYPKVYDDGFFIAMMFIVIAGVAAISVSMQNYGFNKIGEIITRKFRCEVYNKYLTMQIGFFDYPENTPGSLLTKLSSDTTKINGVALSMVGISVQTIVMLIIGIILGFYYDWRLSLINLAFFPFIILTSVMNFKLQQGFSQADIKTEIEAGAILSESVINTKTIYAYNMQPTVIRLYNEILVKQQGNIYCQAAINGIIFGFSQFIMFIIYAVLFYSGGQFMAKGDLSLKSMMSAIFAILFAAFGVGMAQQYVGGYSESKTSLMSLTKIVDQKTEIDPYKSEGVKPEDIPNFKGTIEFDNVSFEYPTRPNHNVMTGLSFKIEAGTSVAFVGKSGCGKSTIIQLLERFYDAKEGEIRISGKNIKDYDLIAYRRKVGLVMQEPVLFKRSLIENVRYGKLEATDQEIYEAADKAHILELVKTNDSTAPISGGEKQRIAIARAIIKNPAILLLDEATSALDEKSEKIVQQALDDVMVGRTSIIIAHRLSTIVKCDNIFLMENGKIVEQGNHQQLLAKKGKYYDLYHGKSKL